MSEREKKTMLWMGLIVAVVIIVILLMRRFASGASGPISFAPNYLSYNFPGARDWQGTATGLPAIPAMDSGSGCGCSSGSNGFYTSLNGMLSDFMDGASKAFNSYEDNVYSSYPSSMTQYFNNPAGASQSANAQATFRAITPFSLFSTQVY